MKKLVLLFALIGTAALAHQGVKNPAVLERMDRMKAIASQMEILGPMAKSADRFDAAQAQAALSIISAEAARTVDLFTAQETDPKSEAKDAIWTSFDEFTAKAQAMQAAAENASGASMQDVQAAMRALGATCKDCHRSYRE